MQNFNSFLLLARNRRVSETVTDEAWAMEYMLCRQKQAVNTVSVCYGHEEYSVRLLIVLLPRVYNILLQNETPCLKYVPVI